jgi:transposase
MKTKSKLGSTARQQRAAVLLAEGQSSGSVAEQLGIHRATLANWKKLLEFEAFYNQLKGEVKAAAQAKMFSLGGRAASTFEELLQSDNERIRLAAASEILRQLSGVQIGPSTAGAVKAQREASAYREDGTKELGETMRRAILDIYGLDPAELLASPAEAKLSRLDDAEPRDPKS